MGHRIFQFRTGEECGDGELLDLDAQHSRIFALVREFGIAVKQAQEPARLLRLLDEILGESELHFATEERLLKRLGHSSYRTQRSAHQQICGELLDLRQRLMADRLAATACAHVMDPLVVHHVRDEPASYAARRGEAASGIALD